MFRRVFCWRHFSSINWLVSFCQRYQGSVGGKVEGGDGGRQDFKSIYDAFKARAAEDRARGDTRLAGLLALVQLEENLEADPLLWSDQQRQQFLTRIFAELPTLTSQSAAAPQTLPAVLPRLPQASKGGIFSRLSNAPYGRLNNPLLRWAVFAISIPLLLLAASLLLLMFGPGARGLEPIAFFLVSLILFLCCLFLWRHLSPRGFVRFASLPVALLVAIFLWTTSEQSSEARFAEEKRVNDALIAEQQRRTEMLAKKLDDGRRHISVHCGSDKCMIGYGTTDQAAQKDGSDSCLGCSQVFTGYDRCVGRVSGCFWFTCTRYYATGHNASTAKSSAYNDCVTDQGVAKSDRCSVDWSSCAPAPSSS